MDESKLKISENKKPLTADAIKGDNSIQMTAKITQILDSARPLSEKIVRFLSPNTPSNVFPNIVSRLLPVIEGHLKPMLKDLDGHTWVVIRWGSYDFFYPNVAPQAAVMRFATRSKMTVDDVMKAAKTGVLKMFEFDEPEGLMLTADKSVNFEGKLNVLDVLFQIEKADGKQ